jgi:catechol 2,3-dioxygenase-like lactoylglutathione lyase family enzyme
VPTNLLTEIDHVAIAVEDLDAAIAWYADVFGATMTHREVVESDGVEEALLAVADSFIQLLSPTTETSTVAKYLATKGEGIDQAPRPGSRGTTVAFVHPKTSFGTLIELVQDNS